jgi:hypothetical protein
VSPAELAAALGGARREGKDWRCKCPAHDDHDPSLSITERDGRTLFVCRAGCDQAAVIAALRQRDLWSVERPDPSPAETMYDYRDADGVLRYQVVRRPQNGSSKKFLQRRPDGKGGWLWNMQGVEPLPYRLPELLAQPEATVWITEGEKDADSLGLIATTSHGGAGKWRQELSHWFEGRDCVILPDADEPGRKHAADVARKLVGIAARIRVLELPGLPPRGDVSDWLVAGGTRERLIELAAAAPDWSPETAAAESEAIDDDAEVARLSKLKPLAFEREAPAAAKRLGCRVSLLRKLVALERGDNGGTGAQGRALEFPEIQAWPDPIDGADLLDAVVAAVKRYVIIDPVMARAVALWIVAVHGFAAFQIFPRLFVTGPEPNCGKTTLADVVSFLVPRPLPVSNISPAALFRVIAAARPTLVLDEFDSYSTEVAEALRQIIDAGHKRGGAVIRVVGEAEEPRLFDAYAPLAIAAIGNIAATLASRSITIRLRRKLASEAVASLSLVRADDLDELTRRIARWAADYRAELVEAAPVMPAGIFNRAADNWRPLLAVADLAGGGWGDLARETAEALVGADQADADTVRVQLLTDIKAAFAAENTDRLASERLVAYLVGLEHRPWPEFGKARKPITKVTVARLLKPLGILPTTVRFADGTVVKGYHQDSFADAFARYAHGGDPPI